MITTVEKHRKATSWIAATLLLAVILFSNHQSERAFLYETIKMIGYVLVVLATLGRIWCAIYISGRKNRELCQDGPYSVWRNPLYIFSFLGVVGFVGVAQSLLLVLIVTPLFWAYHYPIIRSEEERLLELFGEEFTRYRSKVNRFLPSFGNYWSRDTIETNPHMIFRYIIRASFFIWTLGLLEIVKYLKTLEVNGKGVIPLLWNLPF